jgi:V/A-type H+-transporting ATPase subunit I
VIRPQPARWFDILAARDDATLTLEALASTGAVEIEARTSTALPSVFGDLRPQLAEFAELALRHHAYWPAGAHPASAFPEPPTTTLARSLFRLRAWAEEAEPVIGQIERLGEERAEILLWRRVLAAVGMTSVDFARLATAGPVLHARLVVFPPDSEPQLPPGILTRRVDLDGTMVCALAALNVGSADDIDALSQQAAVLKGRVYDTPPWLEADAAATEHYIVPRLEALDHEQRRLAAALAALHRKHDLPTALGDAHRLQWLLENVRALESGELFCRITGWTSDFTGARIRATLERSGARALLHYPEAPPKAKAPLLLANPRWAKPFEVFSRALGIPARNEADPTLLLVLVVPLMFGYMFGDVGQGLVIAAAGVALRQRWPLARLFIAGGIGAAFFGVLFGSVFSLQGVIEPLWIDPLADPLSVLLMPLYGGAVLLTTGLLLTALAAYWRGELRGWFCSEVWLVVVYVALLAAVVSRPALVVAAAASAAFCIGRAVAARRFAAAFSAVAELVERTLQILINTLSFARVGAFALAHAGLSSAIVALMDAADGTVTKALVLIAGNVIVLVLEGLVVSIQTTRLVLFEFFTRFLAAPGRVFHPLPAPPFVAQEH